MATLLIVDDNPEMRRMIRQIAAAKDDSVIECEDGDEVMDAYTAHQPDWVLMDVEMKRMDGLKATSILTQLHAEAKVVIVTKHADEETRRVAREAGALFFISKDDLLSLRTLLRHVNHEVDLN
jgi:CheY-like chemotaxis protein